MDAKYYLDEILNFHPDFSTIKMSDGNWLVRYNGPVASIVFGDEVDKSWDYIERNYRDGVTPHEALFKGDIKGLHNVFDKDGKIGLFARARMFMDADNPHVVKIWYP